MGLVRLLIRSRRGAVALALLLAALHVVAFLALYPQLAGRVAAGGAASVLTAAWLLGMRAGLLAALLMVSLNLVLFRLADPGYVDLASWPAYGIELVAWLVGGALVGRLRESVQYGQREVAERQRAEAALQQAQDTLEQEVSARTAELTTANRQLRGEVQAREQLQAAIEASEERLRIIFEDAPDGYYLNDLRGRLVDGNHAAEVLVGYSREELIGKSFLHMDLLSPTQLPKAAVLLAQNALGRPTGPDEFTLHRKDGTQVPVEIHTHPVSIGGRRLVLGAARDVTARKRVEAALQEAHDQLEVRVAERTAELQQANRRLEAEIQERQQTEAALIEAQAATEAARQADRLKGEFVSNVSHELRTPLTSLLGFSELMVHRRVQPDQVEQYAAVMYLEAQRLRDVIDNLLNLQRLDAGRETYAFGSVELASVVDRTVRVYEGEARRHTLVADVDEGLPAVRADAPKLQQVLANLVNNALKFSPDGGEVRVAAWREGESVHLTVSDEGLGIPADALNQLFERFYRVPETTHEQVRGTGLGLALVREVIAAHEGQVWAESAGTGQGSIFHVALPLA